MSELCAYSCQLGKVFQLTNNKSADYGARWIPGTSNIVFAHWPVERTAGWPDEQRLSAMSVPGGILRPICSLNLKLGMVGRIAVSPDAKQLVVETEELTIGREKIVILFSLWACPLSGGTPRKLYSSDCIISHFAWLPDSVFLLAESDNIPMHLSRTGNDYYQFSFDAALLAAPSRGLLIDTNTGKVRIGVVDNMLDMDVRKIGIEDKISKP